MERRENVAPPSHLITARRLLERPILPALARLAAPNVVSTLALTVVGIAESWYVGRLGTIPLAGLALAFPMLMLMNMLAAGAIGGAVAAAVARALGASRQDRAQALVVHAVGIALAASSVFMAVFLGFGSLIYGALGASGEVLTAAQAYSDVLFAGCPALWLFHTLASVLRGTGDMRTPASALVVVAVCQIGLTGALTQGWGPAPVLGIAGAATSAVCAYSLGTLLLLTPLLSGQRPVRLRFQQMSFRMAHVRDILRVGLPAAISPLQRILTVVLLTALVSRFGPAALAGYGIGARLELLVVPLVFGIGSALVFMVGTHMGAGAVARAHRVAWTGAMVAALIAGMLGITAAVVPWGWAGLFTDDTAVQQASVSYLKLVAPCYAFYGLGLALYFASQGAGKVFWPVLAACGQMAVAVGGGAIAVLWYGAALEILFGLIAVGFVVYGAGAALAIYLGVWVR
jgi:putative MATE family efflux protein